MGALVSKNEMMSLKGLIENEFMIICSLLPAHLFVRYCKERGIQTSEKQLEHLERLRIFYPIARVKYPKIKVKVELLDEGRSYKRLGILKKGEKWSGDVREEYSSPTFKKEYALEWLKDELCINYAKLPPAESVWRI